VPPLDGGFGPATGFYAVLTAAINSLMETGYDSPEQIAAWVAQIRRAALLNMIPESVLQKSLNDTMRAIYRNKIERGGILTQHPGIARFTLERVEPKLRAELDRRIVASANLIRLNRQEAIETTLRRFSGWSTSIPAGGISETSRRATKEKIRKPLASLPFEERRVAVDQGHKFVANLSEILAANGGAIAVKWNSHWRQQNYDYREDHKERDGKIYLLRGNWAKEKGLVKPGSAGYYEDITSFGQEVFCRCFGTYIHSLRRLPEDMLTEKGQEAVANRINMAA
jgi:hypothetical protein